MQEEWSCYRGGQFSGRRMVMLQRWPVSWSENSHVTKVVSLKEGAWSCYRGGQFNAGRKVMLQRWLV